MASPLTKHTFTKSVHCCASCLNIVPIIMQRAVSSYNYAAVGDTQLAASRSERRTPADSATPQHLPGTAPQRNRTGVSNSAAKLEVVMRLV